MGRREENMADPEARIGTQTRVQLPTESERRWLLPSRVAPQAREPR